MAITDPHVLPQDLQIISVADLDPAILGSIEHQDGDFAITRPRSRTPAKIVDAHTGKLLQQFKAPVPIVDAVLQFSQAHDLEPEKLLDDAFPILQRFIDAGLLVEAGSARERRIAASLEAGDRVEDWEIVHCIQVLEDVELYQVKGAERQIAALKIARNDSAHTRRMLEREVDILRTLGGGIAPRLISTGTREGCTYLLMEWRRGVSAAAVAGELRASPVANDRRRLLTLCADIAAAYAELHGRGVLHGDVHDRNLLVDASGQVTILDFGLAHRTDSHAGRRAPQRGGVGAYFEPEYAAAIGDKRSVPPVTAVGEQYSIAALLYTLFAGTTYLNFSADRKEAMRQIAEEPTLAFSSRGVAPLPPLERVLGRALQKKPADRFETVGALAEALRGVSALVVETTEAEGHAAHHAGRSRDVVDATLRQLCQGGAVFASGIVEAPMANVNFGSAGVAHALYRIALTREDPSLLSTADIWATRAVRAIGSRRAFYNQRMGLMRRTVGPTSLYHTESGVHIVQALIARAMGDLVTMNAATKAFVAASGRRGKQLDLTLGRAGILLGCSLLLEAAPRGTMVDLAPLIRLGDKIARELWVTFDAYPPVGEPSDFESLGIAHGWAGILYATLRWQVTRGTPISGSVHTRLRELAERAEPDGRGVRWRWIDNGRSSSRDHGYMSGWCNGSAGFVYLWLTAHAATSDSTFLDLAHGAAWNSWEDHGVETNDLCCGLAGRGYALLALYRATGDEQWRRRASELAARATQVDTDDGLSWVSTSTSLYKGALGAVVLAAELERPESARMPLFEGEGWPEIR